MSYIRTGLQTSGPVPSSGILDDISSGVKNALSATGTAARLVTDPNFNKVVALIDEAYNVEASRSTGVSSGRTSALGDLVMPLEIYVQAKKRPWLKVAIPVLVLGLPFALGWVVGGRK